MASITKLSEELDALRATHSEQLSLRGSQQEILEQQVRQLTESIKVLKKDAEEKQLAEKDARVLAFGTAETERNELKERINKMEDSYHGVEKKLATSEAGLEGLTSSLNDMETSVAELQNSVSDLSRLAERSMELAQHHELLENQTMVHVAFHDQERSATAAAIAALEAEVSALKGKALIGAPADISLNKSPAQQATAVSTTPPSIAAASPPDTTPAIVQSSTVKHPGTLEVERTTSPPSATPPVSIAAPTTSAVESISADAGAAGGEVDGHASQDNQTIIAEALASDDNLGTSIQSESSSNISVVDDLAVTDSTSTAAATNTTDKDVTTMPETVNGEDNASTSEGDAEKVAEEAADAAEAAAEAEADEETGFSKTSDADAAVNAKEGELEQDHVKDQDTAAVVEEDEQNDAGSPAEEAKEVSDENGKEVVDEETVSIEGKEEEVDEITAHEETAKTKGPGTTQAEPVSISMTSQGTAAGADLRQSMDHPKTAEAAALES